jgi:hypothetical protein
MDNNVDKLIQDQIDSLPADVRQAIARVPWKERVRDIAKREGLDVAKADSLETETLLILYGLLPPETYVGNIISEVGVDEEQAERINKLVTDEIIADIEKQFEAIDALAPESVTKAPVEVPQPEKPETRIQTPEIPVTTESKEVEVPEPILPETIPGETAHDVPHMESKGPTVSPAMPSAPQGFIAEKLTQITSVLPETSPKPSYPKGVDPYREPIE